jgi:hypothetical protein
MLHTGLAFRAYYHGDLLGGTVKSELQIMELLKALMLKDVTCSFGESYANYYCKLREKGCRKKWCHGRQYKVNTNSRTRSKGHNLEADDLTVLTEVDAETLVTYHLSEKWEELRASDDTESDPENNSDDFCEVVVPKLSKVLENINRVMT